MIGHAQAILGIGAIIAAAQAHLPGARLMAVFRQPRALDFKLRRRVAVDCPQQLEAALGACRITLLAVGPVTFQAIGGVLHQGLALAGQGGERWALQLCGVGTDRQHLLLLAGIQRLGPLQQFTFA
ncbi:hypothetical protein D9M73_238880 [compost metagenome]